MAVDFPQSEIIVLLERSRAQDAEIAALREQVAKLKAIIRKFQAMLFGPKTEKGAPPAPKTPASPDEATPETPSAAVPAATTAPDTDPSPAPAPSVSPDTGTKIPRGQRRGAPGHGRRLYEELPAREILHDLPEEACRCPQCGEAYSRCGTEDSVTIEWEVTIQRVIHQRQKYCSTCSCASPVLVTAPSPAKLIPKGLLEVSAIAHLVVNKFLHGHPINRQVRELELISGVRLAPGTLAGVLDTVGTLLRPLYDATLQHLREAAHWHADETRWMQYGDEEQHRWWLWVFASTDAVVFVLDPTRSRAVPSRVFGLTDTSATAMRARGIISCDRWKSYQGLEGLLCAYCWAHVRRDFTDLKKGYPSRLGAWADTWVARIGLLYHLNKHRLLCPPGTEAFFQADALLRDHVGRIADARDAEMADPSLLAEAHGALKSLVRHWDGLTVFLDHPWVPLDNNPAERLLRGEVVGRKNFYGSGSLSSGGLAESAFSVLLTADRNGLNPLTYLHTYLDACAQNGGQAPGDITRFLPWKAGDDDIADWTRPLHRHAA